MRQAGLQGVSPRRPRGFTRRDPTADLAPDLVQRDFTANAPNRLWVADISLIPTGEGPWWLAHSAGLEAVVEPADHAVEEVALGGGVQSECSSRRRLSWAFAPGEAVRAAKAQR